MDDDPKVDGGPRIFGVPLGWTFPDLGKRAVPDGGRVEVTSSDSARSEYDTAAHDLRAFGAVLARAAGTDALWTLHIGATGATTVPAQGRGVPREMRDLLLGVRRGGQLRLVRRVASERTTYIVRDPAGVEVGEVADVRERSAEAGDAALVQELRRIEVSGWDGPFPAAVHRRLTRAGATPVAAPSTESEGTVGSALHAYLRSQHDAILGGDLELRRGGDAIHSTRVAVRRLRSALRVVDVSDPDRTAALDAELSWLSKLLGQVRDLQVLRRHLRTAVHEAHEVSLDEAARLIGAVLDEEEATARAELAAGMAGRRYLELLRALRDWHADPPFTAAARRPESRLAGYVRTAGRQLDKRLAGAGDSADGLHLARKAAKRARYVASFAAPVVGKRATATAGRAKQLQQRLGDYQDCVVAADFLQRIGNDADGAAGFGCGVLWTYEQQRAERARRHATA